MIKNLSQEELLTRAVQLFLERDDLIGIISVLRAENSDLSLKLNNVSDIFNRLSTDNSLLLDRLEEAERVMKSANVDTSFLSKPLTQTRQHYPSSSRSTNPNHHSHQQSNYTQRTNPNHQNFSPNRKYQNRNMNQNQNQPKKEFSSPSKPQEIQNHSEENRENQSLIPDSQLESSDSSSKSTYRPPHRRQTD